jgi:hypothetical protein
MRVKITDPRFGGLKIVSTADETGLPEGGSFRLLSMTLPFHRAHHHEVAGVSCVMGTSADGRTTTAPLSEVIAL